MTQCPFCNLTVQNHLVAESNLARVVFSNPRLAKGHLLVMPKRHVEEPWTLASDEQVEILRFISIYQPMLAQTIGTGCELRQNYRPFLPQGRLKVDHVHYHLIPRTLNDELYKKSLVYEKDIFINLSDDEIAEVTNLLGQAR